MSSREPVASALAETARVLALAALGLSLIFASACTVRPLYGHGPGKTGALVGEAGLLSMIAIKPAGGRVEQEVRNNLIFLFGGGAGEPAAPQFTLQLAVTSVTQQVAIRQVADADEPTAGTVSVTATYQLARVGTGEVVSSGNRQAAASYERSQQLYAARRAERDAENRAAREVAEFIRLAIAQDLRRTNP